jgi:hypothetical protein
VKKPSLRIALRSVGCLFLFFPKTNNLRLPFPALCSLDYGGPIRSSFFSRMVIKKCTPVSLFLPKEIRL